MFYLTMLPSLQPYKGKKILKIRETFTIMTTKECTLQNLCKIKFPLPAEDLLFNLPEDKVCFENALKSR